MHELNVNRTLVRLIESWATTENPFNSTEEILAWVEEKNRDVKVEIRKVPYDYTGEDWHYDAERGEIRNRTGSFFQIRGLRKICDWKVLQEQPIIIQNEIIELIRSIKYVDNNRSITVVYNKIIYADGNDSIMCTNDVQNGWECVGHAGMPHGWV